MKLRFLASLLFIAPALLPGQDKGTMLNPWPSYTEIKQYLSMTDAQMQSLQTVMDNRNQAMQNIYTQINQKYDTLYQLQNSDSASALQLGQILIDIRNLQKQLPLIDGPYRSQALNVLTAEQNAKLPKLSEALQLQGTAGQAGMLLLIDYPSFYGRFDVLPMSGGPGTADPSMGAILRSAPANAQRMPLLPARR